MAAAFRPAKDGGRPSTRAAQWAGHRPVPGLRDVSRRWQGEGVGCFSGELELSKTKQSAVPASAMELLSCVLLWKLVLLQSECGRVVWAWDSERVNCLSLGWEGWRAFFKEKDWAGCLKTAVHLEEPEAFRSSERKPRETKRGGCTQGASCTHILCGSTVSCSGCSSPRCG